MAALSWILTLLCAAGCHLSSASPVLHSALVVQAGQNVSMTCNLTSTTGITWYLLRSDELLPLLTVSTAIGGDLEQLHTADGDRIKATGSPERGPVGVEILGVQEEDAGLFFCATTSAGVVRAARVVRLAVGGFEADPARHPYWTLAVCVLPALLVLSVVVTVGVCLCSGKPVCCCRSPRGGDAVLKLSEDDSLHYSSLMLADKPHPSNHRGTGLAEMNVTYSTVATSEHPNGSHDHRQSSCVHSFGDV